MKVLSLISILSIVSANPQYFTTFSQFHHLREQQMVENGEIILRASEDSKIFSQRLDHFNGFDSHSFFNQRYYFRDFSMGKENPPIFIVIGGEAPLPLISGTIKEHAETFEGLVYSLEHRGFGETLKGHENLKYINTQQALADLAFFAASMKRHIDQPVILYGCSYPGSLAAYARQFYPHIFTGALSSSSPVAALSNFEEYDETVARVVRDEASEECLSYLQTFTDFLDRKFVNASDSEAKSFIESLGCYGLDVTKKMNRAMITLILAGRFSYAVQYRNSITPFSNNSLEFLCSTMGDRKQKLTTTESMDEDEIIHSRLKIIMNIQSDNCVNSLFINYVMSPGDYSTWTYMTCAQYGYWQVRSSKIPARSRSLDADFYRSICDAAFPLLDNKTWKDEEKHSNDILFGGKQSALMQFGLGATNIHFTNGKNDPWASLSITPEAIENSNLDAERLESVRGITSHVMEGKSHCEDFYVSQRSDDVTKKAYRKQQEAIKRFLDNTNQLKLFKSTDNSKDGAGLL